MISHFASFKDKDYICKRFSSPCHQPKPGQCPFTKFFRFKWCRTIHDRRKWCPYIEPDFRNGYSKSTPSDYLPPPPISSFPALPGKQNTSSTSGYNFLFPFPPSLSITLSRVPPSNPNPKRRFNQLVPQSPVSTSLHTTSSSLVIKPNNKKERKRKGLQTYKSNCTPLLTP